MKHLKPIADLTPEAEDWISISAAELFRRQEPRKHEGLFTMFEGWPLPPMFNRQLPLADYVITPTTWVQGLFQKYVPDLPRCYVVHHGVDHRFTFADREWPKDRPFRFMWCGSTDDRKNWKAAMDAWQVSPFFRDPGFELYLKTSAPLGRLLPKHPVYHITIDNRVLGRGALVRLYHKAHCFIFPTMGEGFGFTLAEAMRTGLPCIATGYSGHMDYFDEGVGYPIPWKWGTGTATFIGGREHARIRLAMPEPKEIARAMTQVVADYGEALRRGRKAHERIARDYTWEGAARKLVDIVRTEQAVRQGREVAA